MLLVERVEYRGRGGVMIGVGGCKVGGEGRMGEEKRKYEMEECKECEIEGKNATNGYSSGGLCIFWVDMNIDRTCS